MKKIVVIISIMIFAILGVSLGYYFLSYVPYKTAVSNFEKASVSLKEKNKDIEDLISEAEALVEKGEEALESNTLDDLKNSVEETQKSIRKVPEMEKKTKDIENQINEMNQPISYEENQNELKNKLEKYKNSVTQLKQITNPSSTFIEERLKEVDTITGVQSVTESNDPNKHLNKQGGYTASVYFVDNQVTPPVEGSDIIQKGNDAGGNIEVYKTKEEAEQRNKYISAYDGTSLQPGSHYVYGTVLIRTSSRLTASQQEELTKKIYQKFIEIK